MRPAIGLPPLRLGMKTRLGINLKTRLGITPSGVRLATRDNRRTKRGPTRDPRPATRSTKRGSQVGPIAIGVETRLTMTSSRRGKNATDSQE